MRFSLGVLAGLLTGYLVFGGTEAIAQSAARLFGTTSGAPVAIGVTGTALNVVAQ